MSATRPATVALVGNPNVGKSCLFNAATRSEQDVRNAPGTTVEMSTGTWDAADVRLLDLPGTYSLLARSPDEQVTTDTLAGRLLSFDGLAARFHETRLPPDPDCPVCASGRVFPGYIDYGRFCSIE